MVAGFWPRLQNAQAISIDITTVSLTISQLTDDNMEEALKGMERAAKQLANFDVNVIYQSGVPPVVGAMMMFKGAWTGKGVFNVEQLPAEPFLEELGPQGLPWRVRELKADDQGDLFAVKT